jgi:predicted RNA-binding protein with PIN domain
VPLIRILVDGYSLLHSFPELAPGKPRYSAVARQELILWLTQYRDSTGIPITVIFDGAGAPSGTPKMPSSPEMEILFSEAGKTADDLIERAAHRLAAYGEVLVVTDDLAERDTIEASGALASSCTTFIRTVEAEIEQLHRDVDVYNRHQLKEYRRRES